MKKTSVISINLKTFRLPFLFIAFLTVVSLSMLLSVHVPQFKLSSDIIDSILCSNVFFESTHIPTSGAYSLVRKVSDTSTPLPDEKPKLSQEKSADTPLVPPVTNPNPTVTVASHADMDINPDDYLESLPAFMEDDFSVLIVHTHTTESFTPSEKYSYTPTDIDRTTDKNFNMVRVGNEIEKILSSSGINVYHDESINDHPSYNGSYDKSAKVIESQLKKDSSIKIVLDVHRDAVEGKNGEKIKYTTNISGKPAAKIMLVAGSNLSGLSHSNWEENMRFAVNLQKHILSLYPDLCRPINFRNQRFNQHLAPGGIIVEVGTNGNTLDEAIYGAQCFAVALADFIDTQKH